jgi:hypothetical protein
MAHALPLLDLDITLDLALPVLVRDGAARVGMRIDAA